jgi:hypothetical protein
MLTDDAAGACNDGPVAPLQPKWLPFVAAHKSDGLAFSENVTIGSVANQRHCIFESTNHILVGGRQLTQSARYDWTDVDARGHVENNVLATDVKPRSILIIVVGSQRIFITCAHALLE